jgi:hypothetical protein
MFAQGFSKTTLEFAEPCKRVLTHADMHQCTPSCSLLKCTQRCRMVFKDTPHKKTKDAARLQLLPMLSSTFSSCATAASTIGCCYDVFRVRLLCIAVW